ncbi:MAG: zinc-ribbon domain-containing protein, partial [Lachnospiraceae bacterium]|nr:zinc-ribbon domain-containing protein [Lachnospiraceae bacterium]
MGAGEMKYCRNCGQQISRNAKFCKFCGYQFEVQQEPAAPAMKYCGSCGKENAADAAFCRYCGQPMQQGAAQQSPAASSAGRTAQQRPAAPSAGRPMQQAAPGQGQPPVRKKWLIPVVIVISAMVIFSGVIYFMIARGVIQELSGKPGNTGETAQSVQSGESVPGQESAAQAGDIWELTDEQKAEMAEIGEMPDLDPEDYIEKEPAEPLSAHGYDWLYPEGEDWEFPEEEENTSESASVDEVPQDPLQDHPSPAFSTSPVKGITISGAEGALDKERTFTMTEVPDEQYQALNDKLEAIDDMGG